MAYVEEVMNDYRNSLRDLNFNSKPLINMLTMLAEENEQHAPCIVKVIEDEIIKVKSNRKLPILYLIDSIIKNLPKTSYKSLFSKNLVHTFTTVFEQVDEKTRASMYKLRQTWTPLIPNAKLYGIDVKIQSNLDPAWPVTATAPEQTIIHVNPNFLRKSETETSPEPEPEPEMSPEPTPEGSPKEEENLEEQESLMRQQLIAKQQELLKLQQARLELELAEAKEKLQKQKKKNTKLSSFDEQVLPDTTVQPTSLDTVPAPRDPRAGRDPHARDPRLKGSPLPTQSSLVPHSTTPSVLALPPEAPVPLPESALIPAPSFSGLPGMPHYPGAVAPGMQPPFIQSGKLHVNPGFLASQHAPRLPVEGHFKGEVYHPDSSDDSETKSQDSGSGSRTDKPKVKPKEPATNRRDPRQARNEAEHRPMNNDNFDSNRDKRENDRSNLNRNSNYDRNSNRSSNRNSKGGDRDPRRSRSPHSSSRSPRTSESGRDRSDSKSNDPRLRHLDDDSRRDSERSQDESMGPNVRSSPNKQRSSQSKNDDRRLSRDKSPERSPKYSRRSDKSGKDRLDKSDERAKNQNVKKGSSKERSISPSKGKVRNKIDNAKKSGSVERTEKGGKDVKVKTPKRELEKDDLVPVEDERENLSKKARIEPVDEKPNIVEGADVLGKIQEDISELFGGEDQDYRPTDSKGLPLKSPSSKGWDKFKADHPDQYAYDIELKRQRSESMDVDQRPSLEPQDTDYRLQHQSSWSEQSDNESRRASTEDVSIPVELSMEHHAEILIQAHKHLQEGKLTHEQHQLLLQQLGELMKIQKLQEETRKIQQLQEESRRLSLEAERIKQGSVSLDEDIRNMSPVKPEIPMDKDLRKPSPMTPEDTQRLPPIIDGTPPGPPVSRPLVPREKISTEKLPPERLENERFQKEGSPQKHAHKGVPEFERQGPLHNLYPDIPRGPPLEGRPPFPPNLPPNHPDFRGPHPGPPGREGDFRGPPDHIPHDNRPPFDGRDRYDGGPVRDQNHRDVREHPPGDGRDAPPGVNMPPMQPPPKPFFVKDGTERIDGPRRDVGPFDRGDHNRNDFGPGDRRDRGPPPQEMVPSERFDNIPVDGRDFDGRPGPQDRMGPERMHHGSPDMRIIGPPGPGHGPPPHGRDYVSPSQRGDLGPPEQVGRGFPDRREGPPDRREMGPPDRFKAGPPGETGMEPPGIRDHGPPDRFDEGHPDGQRPDRMVMQDDRRDFEFHGRRDGPPGERGFGPPDRMNMGPPGRMGHGPSGMGFDGRDEPPGGRGRGRGFGPPGRMEMGPPDRDGLGRRGPDWRDHGPPGRGHPGRDGPPGSRGPEWRDHGPPDRMGGGPDFRPDGPYDGRDFGPLDRRDHGPLDRRGMGPDPREHGLPHERRDGPPDRFHDRRDFGPEDRMDMGPTDFDERGPTDRFGHDRRDQRPPHGRDREHHGRYDGPPDRRSWEPQDDRREWGPPGRAHGPPDRIDREHPEFRGHGPMDRMPHGPPERRDHRPPDDMGPQNRRDGPPDWNDRGPGWRDHGPPDRSGEPERWIGPPDMRDGPNDRKHGPHVRDDRKAGPLGDKLEEDIQPKDNGDKEPHEEKKPDWPLEGQQRPFNPGKAELEKIEKMVSERKTPPIDEAKQLDSEDSKPSKDVQEHEVRQSSVEKDNKPAKKPKDNEKKPASAETGEKKGRKSPLLPTPPAHLKKSESDTKEDKAKTDAPANKDIKYIPALLELPTIKPTKELSIEPIKDLSGEETVTEEGDINSNTGLGQWKTIGISEKPGKQPDKNKNKKKDAKVEHDSDEEPEERRNNPFAIGSFLKEMLPPAKDNKKPPAREEKKPAKKVEKRQLDRDKKKPEREERPHGRNETRPPGRNERRQHRDEKRLQDRDERRLQDRDERRPPDERRGHGKDEKLPPNIEEIGPPSRDEMKPPGRGEMRPPGRDEMTPPGRGEMRPLGRDEMRPPGRDEMRPPGWDESRLGRDEMRPPGREDMRPLELRQPGRWEGPPRHPDGRPMGPDGPRPPLLPGPRGPAPHGPMMAGPRGPMMDGPHGPPPPGMGGPGMNPQGIEEDPRWTSYTDMGPEVSEEVVIGNKNYAIKLGDRPRVVKFFNEKIEVYADPSKRGIVIDGNLLYKFGERVKEVEIRGRTIRMFYHGKPVNLWIDGQNYEVRVDAPPRNIEINGSNHKIQIDGRDMMILIDKSEKGPYGGPPRFIYIDEDRMEIRFDPPPRHILIDGKLCELMLNMKRPCVNIEGKLHGIRFDGPPREAVINNQVFSIHTDRAVKVRVDNKLYYISLGGPCHELIIDGKWYEMKFSEPPKEINVGNKILAVHLPGKPPEVKILPEILPPMPGPPGMPMGPGMIGPGPMRPMGPGMEPVMRGPVPVGPGQRPMSERPPFQIAPRPEMIPLRPEVSQPGVFPINRPPISGAQPMASSFPVPDSQPRPVLAQPPVSMGPPVTSAGGMPNVLASMFPNIPQPRIPASTPAPPTMDINILLQKLVATGIIKKEPEPSTATTTTAASAGSAGTGVKPLELLNVRKKVEKQESIEDIPDMTDMAITQMKELSNGVIQRLYAGIQCTTCGVRFVLDDEEKTEKYREHLDWHFRQKRREKDEMKFSRSRHWYYGVNDWIQYEEITDTEETAHSTFFERQQQLVQQPTPATPSNMSFALITVPEGATVTRCPAATGNDNDDLCAICHEPFEQFWDEELEEWHLRDAIRVNNLTYHPICYEDHTDVSEGTPSPSALPMMPPDFSARKTLSYDESSQDAINTSFEGERQVVKTEPVLETDSKDADSANEDAVSVASKDAVSAVKDVITISDSPIKPVTWVNVKSEPMDTTVTSEPMDTTDSAIVKQENENCQDDKTVVQYEVTSIVKTGPGIEDGSNSQTDTTSVNVPMIEEIKSSDSAINQSVDQKMTDTSSASQNISESTQNDVVTTETVAVATNTVTMATNKAVASAVPQSVISSSEAVHVAGSPAPQESGGSTPVQDERSRSNTPVNDECPGTPVQDEPMVE